MFGKTVRITSCLTMATLGAVALWLTIPAQRMDIESIGMTAMVAGLLLAVNELRA